MGFKLRDIVGTLPAGYNAPKPCPGTGKTVFRTKREADAALTSINQTQRTDMKRFLCGYCGFYHLGHPRGRVW